MAFFPVSGFPPQYRKETDDTPASGYFIKFYNAANTAINMYSDSAGNGALAKCQLDANGYPINGSSARFIPFIDQEYKIALYTNSTDADADTTNNAEWYHGPYNPTLDNTVGLPIVSSAGSAADVITADFAIAPASLTDGLSTSVRLLHGANTTTTPTFTPNTLAAKTIVRGAGVALEVGDTGGIGNYINLVYSSALDQWVLTNPYMVGSAQISPDTVVAADIAAGAVDTSELATDAVTTVKITDSNVTNAKLADMTADTIKGRANGAGTGAPQDLTATQVRTIINVEDGAEVNNISDANATDLTDGGTTTLHKHTASTIVYPKSVRDGLKLEIDSPDGDHDVVINTGSIADSGGTTLITLSSALTKQIDANWAAGDDQGGFPSGLTLTANTWYRVFVIAKTDGTTDCGFDTSATATNLLADATGYTLYRRIGWIKTNGSNNLHKFFTSNKSKNYYFWDVHEDHSVSASATRVLVEMLGPPFSTVIVKYALGHLNNDGGGYGVLTETSQTNTAPSSSMFHIIRHAGSAESSAVFEMNIDADSELYHRESDAGISNVYLSTLGWIDDIEVV